MQVNRLVAEAFGTFCIVFAGCGAIVVNDIHGSVTHVGVALVFGLVVLAMIHAVGDVSGAHLNPAVTLGFVATRRFPASQAPAYILAQCLGALLASLTLRGLFAEHPSLGATRPAGTALQSFVLEFLLTLILMVVILGVAVGSQEKGIMAGVAVGGVIALEALFAGPVSGASMNPARSLAPALVSGNLASLWIYLAAPPLGALAGVALSRIMHPPTRRNRRVKPKVIFVCVENSNRSQMAEAFARMAGGVEAFSAGSRPSGHVNPKAVEAMKELGYDLTTHASKRVADFDGIEFDAAVTMGCGDNCPTLRAKRRFDWAIPDPREMGSEEFRGVRDLIAEKVQQLLENGLRT